MQNIYIFDVDGTLTPSRQKLDPKFKMFFERWAKNNKFYLVTGSDIAKLQEQMDGLEIHADGIFTCCGNQMWESDPAVHPKHCDLIYENKFKVPENLLTYLGQMLRESETPVKANNHIEDRGSMLNFSTIGRNCTLEERQQYFEWDNKIGERKKIAKEIRDGWKDLDAVIGGQISIDIYPKGMDKSQVLKHIQEKEEIFCPHKYIFFGDRTMKGGNDYPLANYMNSGNAHLYSTHQVEDYKKTWWLLMRYEMEKVGAFGIDDNK